MMANRPCRRYDEMTGQEPEFASRLRSALSEWHGRRCLAGRLAISPAGFPRGLFRRIGPGFSDRVGSTNEMRPVY
jgi:hypothetical protein